MHTAHTDHIQFLDGIRGFAIIFVVLYHVGLIKSGYLGVDIFFVLSGFLIAKVISGKVIKNQFSFVGFYESRVFRIFPMALLVLIVSLIMGCFMLFHNEFIELQKYVHYILMFRANELATTNIDYFDLGVNYKPLIHFWSLSVEIQFYLIIPIVLYFFLKNHLYKSLIVFLLIMISASLYYSFINMNDQAIYYASFGRLYQFLLGSLLYLLLLRYKFTFLKNIQTYYSFLINILLMLLIIYIVFLDNILPVSMKSFSISLLLFSLIALNYIQKNNLIITFFSNQTITFIGLISYSIYIIHYPVLAFFRILLDRELYLSEILSSLFLILFLSVAGYFFIERFFIQKKQPRRWKYFLLLFAITLIGSGQLFTRQLSQFVFLKDKEVQQYLDYSKDNHPHLKESRVSNKIIDLEKIYIYKNETNKTKKIIAFWGDSHLNQISYPLAQIMNQEGYEIYEFSVAGCPPVCDTSSTNENRKCNQNTTKILKYIISNEQIKEVVIFAYWYLYFQEGSLKLPTHENKEYKMLFFQNIQKTINILKAHNKKVYLVYPTPVMKHNVPFYIARSIKIFNNEAEKENCITEHEFKEQTQNISNYFDMLIDHKYVYKIDIASYLNQNGMEYCSIGDNGAIYYRDNNHLSLTFAKHFAPDIAAQIMKKD